MYLIFNKFFDKKVLSEIPANNKLLFRVFFD